MLVHSLVVLEGRFEFDMFILSIILLTKEFTDVKTTPNNVASSLVLALTKNLHLTPNYHLIMYSQTETLSIFDLPGAPVKIPSDNPVLP